MLCKIWRILWSDQLVQVEDTLQEGQDKKEEEPDQRDIKEEDNGIEMSEDFDGKMHDGVDQEPGNRTHVFKMTNLSVYRNQ